MSRFARVGSVETLKEFRASLCTFSATVSTALDEANSEIQRTLIWLKQDQNAYWKAQVRHRTEQLARARSALSYKKNFEESSLAAKQSHIDEKRAVATAQRRLQEAQEKLEKVRRWTQQFEKEAAMYKGRVQGLGHIIDAEIPNARAQMDKMIDSLESYVALAPPPGAAAPAEQPYCDSPVPSEDMTPMPQETIPQTIGAAKSYAALRKMTPLAAVRSQVQVGSVIHPWLSGPAIKPPVRKLIEEIGVEPVPILADDKIVIAGSSPGHRRIYLERTDPCSPDDCGWYVGIVDNDNKESLDCEAVRLGDFLDLRGDLVEILTLPVGYLVVLDGDSIEAVVDPHDKVVWMGDNK